MVFYSLTIDRYFIYIYICIKCCENISIGLKVIERTSFHIKNDKKTEFSKQCIWSKGSLHLFCILFYICTKFYKSAFNSFEVIQQTKFQY